MFFAILALFFAIDVTPPALQVIEPADGTVVNTNVVEFRGVTEWGGQVSSGPFEADTSEYGEWTIQLALEPGDNGAVFTARDRAGNEKHVRIVVTYEPPEAAEPQQEPLQAPETPTPVSVTTTTTRAPTTTTTTLAPKPKTVVTGVEQWRPLVAKHFLPGNVETALRVMACESGGNPDAMNRSRTAAGLFQHLLKYWEARAEQAGYPGGNIFDPETNIAVSAWLAETHGWSHWTCY